MGVKWPCRSDESIGLDKRHHRIRNPSGSLYGISQHGCRDRGSSGDFGTRPRKTSKTKAIARTLDVAGDIRYPLHADRCGIGQRSRVPLGRDSGRMDHEGGIRLDLSGIPTPIAIVYPMVGAGHGGDGADFQAIDRLRFDRRCIRVWHSCTSRPRSARHPSFAMGVSLSPT